MRRLLIGLVLLFPAFAATASAQGKPPSALTQARQLYNDHKYDDAIRVAAEARTVPSQASAAAIILARAHLERYRTSLATEDLDAARDALKGLDVSGLEPRDRTELTVALGLALYLDDRNMLGDRFSAAAEQFELALGQAATLDDRGRDALFDWWASSLDRQAQQGPETGRRVIYQRVLDGAEHELAAHPASVSAPYWLAASARGVDDFTRAAGAAVAGWIRAGFFGARGADLRADLDRLMRQVILPERARELVPVGDPRPALALLEAQWEDIKGKW